MRIEKYSFIALFIKLTLPVRLPGNPCFPSGDLPGLGVFEYVICFLPGNDRETAGKRQGMSHMEPVLDQNT